jgi:hypothetical protein
LLFIGLEGAPGMEGVDSGGGRIRARCGGARKEGTGEKKEREAPGKRKGRLGEKGKASPEEGKRQGGEKEAARRGPTRARIELGAGG